MKFDVNTFRFVADIGLENGWNNFSLEDLQGYANYLRSEGMEADMPLVFKAVKHTETFVDAIESALIDEEPATQVVSGFSEQGVLSKVGGPRFYKTDDGEGIVLRVGTTSYEAVLENEKITVGKLKGGIIALKRTSADGSEVINDKTGLPSLEVTAQLRIVGERAKDAEVFYIPFMLDMELPVTDGEISASVEDGDLHQYLAPIPKGGATFVDLRMLPQGDFLVTDISDPKIGDYNGKPIKSWNLTIPNIGIVSSRGKNLEGQLETSYKILQKVARSRGVTLRISSHEVEYKTMSGEDRKVPFPNFVMDLKAGNVKNLPEGKIGNSDVKHLLNAGILKDYAEPTQEFAIASVEHLREVIGVANPNALPQASTSVAASLSAAPMKSAAVPSGVVDPDNIPF